LHKWKYKLL